MPVTVKYLKDEGDIKKGARVRMLAPAFLRLRKKGIVERVATTPEDLDESVLNPNKVEKPKAPKKNVSINSLKNLVTGSKKKK